MQDLTAKEVAAEFNISVYRLRSIIEYALDLDIAVDKISSKDLVNTITYLDHEDSYYPIKKELYSILKEQYEELQHLETVAELASEYNVSGSSLQNYIHKNVGEGEPFLPAF